MKRHFLYTLTVNPALDLSGHVPKITPNEKNYVHRARFDPGGNAINAARVAKRLGAKPLLLGFLGGSSGEQLKGLLDQEGLSHRFTSIRGTTRINITVTNDEDHRQTRLTFPGPRIHRSEAQTLLQVVRGLRVPGIAVFGGSTPGGCSRAFYSSMIRAAQSRGLGVIVDVPALNLNAILKANLKRLLLIKPNQNEFESLMGRKLGSDLAIAKAAYKLLSKCEMICISLAERGAILAWNNQAWLIQPPRIHAKGTVGAGDSMVGAMAACLLRTGLTQPELCHKANPEMILDVIRWGIAAGAATATTEGTALGKASLIRKLYRKTKARRIFQYLKA